MPGGVSARSSMDVWDESGVTSISLNVVWSRTSVRGRPLVVIGAPMRSTSG